MILFVVFNCTCVAFKYFKCKTPTSRTISRYACVEVAGSLVLWEPTQRKQRVGGHGQHCTYNVDQMVMRDTGLKDVREIRGLMLKRDD